MAKKIYPESIKKWLIENKVKLIASGVAIPGTLIGAIFLYLSLIGVITITGHSGDMICAGTELDPCYAYLNFTANEDVFIYPTNYDPWGRDTIMNFDPKVKSWRLQRSWGKGWRDIPMNETCTGTWCGAPNNRGVSYSYVLREGRDYQFRIVAYKNSPQETIKWGFFDLDPEWVASETYTSSTKTVCNNDGVCNKILYAGTMFIKENNTWGNIEDALSLIGMNWNMEILENESNYSFEIEDFNYTCFKKLKIKSEVGGEIPFKLDGIVIDNYTFVGGDEIEIEDFCVDNIFAHNFTLGANSTTIILQDADTEVLNDDDEFQSGTAIQLYCFDDGSPNSQPAGVMFNISSVPAGQTIDDASYNGNTVDTDGCNDHFEIFEYDNHTWNEEDGIDGGAIAGNLLATNACAGGTDVWKIFNVTSWVSSEYGDGDLNVSFICKMNASSFTYSAFATKEHSNVSRRHYLNITYSAVAGDNAPIVVLSTPVNGTSSATTDYNFTCNVTDDFNISNTTIFVWRDNETLFSNLTNTSTGTSLNYSFAVPTLDIDGYVWNCEAFDNASQSARAAENFTLTVTAVDTCTCPGATNNWEVNMSHNCNLTSACTLTTGNLTWIGSSGYFNCSAQFNLTNRDAPPSGTTFYHSSGCELIRLIVLVLLIPVTIFKRKGGLEI